MTTLQIRQMPKPLYALLSFRAERAHRSLTQQAVIELQRALGADGPSRRRQVLDAIQRRLEQPREATAAVDVATLDQWLRADRER